MADAIRRGTCDRAAARRRGGVGNVARPARCRSAHGPLRAALLASMVLFAVGGAIGFVIQGSNVKIPAHYQAASSG